MKTIFSMPEKPDFTCKTVQKLALIVWSVFTTFLTKKAKLEDFFKLVSCLWIVHHKDRKLAGIDSVSTCVLDNVFCKLRIAMHDAICWHCYAANQQKMHIGLKEHNILNGKILKSILIPIKAFKILQFTSKFIRIESFGDVDNVIQARNYIRMIKAFPAKRFAIWSKNIGIWAQAFNLEGKPANCVYVHSSLKTNKPDTYVLTQFDFIDHIFTVFDKKYAIENNIVINCGGRKCMDCIVKKVNCYFKNNTIFINELLK